MKSKKRIISLVVATFMLFALVLGVAGCGAGQTDEEKAQALVEKATTSVEENDIKAMYSSLDKIVADYPDTDTAKNIEKIKNDMYAKITTVTAPAIASEFAQNEVGAKDKYKGKWVIVTGKVDTIGSVGSSAYITLSDGQQFSLTCPHFSFSTDEEKAKVGSLAKGKSVKLLAKCSGTTLGSATFKDCYILQ